MRDVWQSVESYDAYIGRWSRDVAREFVSQLSVAPRSRWLDVGCGSGALTDAILASQDPTRVCALDRSIEFVQQSRRYRANTAASFVTGDAIRLPFSDGEADAVVSGLVLNFVADPELALREMLRCLRPGGVAAVYLWDYREGMQLVRFFWDAAIALNPAASALDEANRFPLCQPAAIEELFVRAGAVNARISAITVATRFREFDELWSPFLGGQGPAPTYVTSLPDEERSALREQLRRTVQPEADGSICLTARAWVGLGSRRN